MKEVKDKISIEKINFLVPEEKIFGLLAKEFQTIDKFANGILLENFPKTLVNFFAEFFT